MDRRDFFIAAAATALMPRLALAKQNLRVPRPANGRARPFRLGVTRWPPDLTVDAVARTGAFIADKCDLAAPMLIGGVPWSEALNGSEFSAHLRHELAYRPPAGHKLFVSIGALDMGRSKLAPYWGEKDNLPLPAAFQNLPFDAPQIKDAYTNFALRVVKAMRPDWFAIGIEPNVLLSKDAKAWPAYKALHQHVYQRVKAQHPRLKVCFTIEALHYLGKHQGSNAAVQRREVLELLTYSDMAAFSVYPHMSWDVPRPLPDDFFRFARELAAAAGGKPIAISEGGYTSRNVWVGIIPLFGSPENQARYMTLLLEAADQDRYEFVVNYAAIDFERLVERLSGDVATLARIWMYTGLLTSDGTPKPALGAWLAALARPVAEP